MGRAAHMTAHFCEIPAAPCDKPRQKADRAQRVTARRIRRVKSRWQAEASARAGNGEPHGFGHGLAASGCAEKARIFSMPIGLTIPVVDDIAAPRGGYRAHRSSARRCQGNSAVPRNATTCRTKCAARCATAPIRPRHRDCAAHLARRIARHALSASMRAAKASRIASSASAADASATSTQVSAHFSACSARLTSLITSGSAGSRPPRSYSRSWRSPLRSPPPWFRNAWQSQGDHHPAR